MAYRGVMMRAEMLARHERQAQRTAKNLSYRPSDSATVPPVIQSDEGKMRESVLARQAEALEKWRAKELERLRGAVIQAENGLHPGAIRGLPEWRQRNRQARLAAAQQHLILATEVFSDATQ